MGDGEATVKRYYIETLEPDAGRGQHWHSSRCAVSRMSVKMTLDPSC
jgi:hypothetical protein